MGDFNNLTKNAHEVLCPDFSDLSFCIASPDQLTRNIPYLADIVTSIQSASAVEIGSDPHMVDTDDPDDVIYVVNYIGHTSESARVLLIRCLCSSRAFLSSCSESSLKFPYFSLNAFIAASRSGFGVRFLT